MKKKYWVGSLLSALVIVGAIMIQPTLAAFTSQDSKTNEFKTGTFDIKIIENGKEENGFTTCEFKNSSESSQCQKEVKIKNSGSTPAIIRVALAPYWEYNGNPWPGDVSGVTPNVIEENLCKENLTSPCWIKGEDNYYYYIGIVPSGNFTQELISSVSVEIPNGLEERYSSKNLIVDVKAEAVTPNEEAIKKIWPSLWDENNGEFNRIGKMLKAEINKLNNSGE